MRGVRGARVVLVDESYLPLLPPSVLTFGSHQEAVAEGKSLAGPQLRIDGGELVQFTSGSTGAPRGVRLSLDKLAANIEAILDVLELGPGDLSCSWLPLTHDMGLVGLTLAPMCAGGRVGGGEVVLLTPEHFLRRPASWLAACSELRATVTAGPDFGLAIAARAGGGPLDLSALRVCITGAEPVRAQTLIGFEEQFAPAGLPATALCPAYGLAEAALAVTMVRPRDRWHAVEPGELGISTTPGSGSMLVSCGRPLDGYQVASGDPTGGPSPILVSGPSTFDGYLHLERQESPPVDLIRTGDLGVVVDGELFVVGRSDDVVVIAGRNLHLVDAERTVLAAGMVQSGRIQATPTDGGGYRLVVEFDPDGDEMGSTDPSSLAARIRVAATAGTGISPDEVLFVERGELLRTASSKPRRRLTGSAVEEGTLVPWHRCDYEGSSS